MTFNYNIEYYELSDYWDFMRDSYAGFPAIVSNAENKNYLKRRSNMDNDNWNFYKHCGRYPELISRIVRQSVSRTILRRPDGYETIQLLTNNPKKFLNWILNETILVGSCGIALSFENKIPQLVCYNTENVINWSENSVAFKDARILTDQFGFEQSRELVETVYHTNENGFVQLSTVQDDVIIESDPIMADARNLKLLPAIRIDTGDKPIFFSLAKSCIDYYRVTALRSYIMHQIVPQPVLTLPSNDTEESWEMSQLYPDSQIDYGVGTFMKLPKGAKFEIVSPVVRSLGETRQDLQLIKDEMIIQGAQPYFQKAGQVNTLNKESIRSHTEDQIMISEDPVSQIEHGINHIISCASEYMNKELTPFKFNRTDVSVEEIQDIVKSMLEPFDTRREVPPEIVDQVIEEMEERGLYGNEQSY